MNKGFTLIELLVVVLIIGILSAVALPQYTKAVEKARSAEAVQILSQLAKAQLAYQMAQNTYTKDLTVLDVELPGICGTSNSYTKNFKFTMDSASSTAFQATASRWAGNAAAASPNNYSLKLTIDSTGAVKIQCNGGGTGLCKSIANGDASNYVVK